MIYFCKGEKQIQANKLFMIKAKDESSILVSKDVYDQAVLLQDRYSNPLNIRGKFAMDKNDLAMFRFVEIAPDPIKMFGCFLLLVEEPIPEESWSLETFCGILHVITKTVDCSNYLTVSQDMRKDLKFTLKQVMDYQDSWDELETKIRLIEVDEDSATKEYITGMVTEITKNMIKEIYDSTLEFTKSLISEVVESIPKVVTYAAPSIDDQANYVGGEFDKAVESMKEEAEEELDLGTVLGNIMRELEVEEAANEANEQESKEEEDPDSDADNNESEPVEEKTSVIDNIIALYGGM